MSTKHFDRDHHPFEGQQNWKDQGSDPSSPPSGEQTVYSKTAGLFVKNASAVVVGPLTDGHTAIEVILEGGGVAITTGIKGDIELPFAGKITAVRLFADQSGSIVIDLWKDVYANFPPDVADTITASAKPTLSSATHSQDSTLTGWTTTFAKGDILRVNVDSVATVTRVTLSLTVSRT
jgi:hypothetical protein